MPASIPAPTITADDPSLSLYNSSEDSDFAASQSDYSSDFDTGTRTKRKAGDELASGDEGVIDAGRKKKRKKRSKKKDGQDHEDDIEEGVGERVRRRRAGGIDDKPKKPLATTESATVDVDELWARMNSAPTATSTPPAAENTRRIEETQIDSAPDAAPPTVQTDGVSSLATNPGTLKAPVGEEMIHIRRTYEFAGETITEEKQVPKSSAEARLYLESQAVAGAENSPSTTTPHKKTPLRRPKKRASMFEPPPDNTSSPLSSSTKGKGQKLNTIEKSKLDWAGYVDKEGIKDELEGAEKAKDGYLGKMDFLDKMSAKREFEMSSMKKK